MNELLDQTTKILQAVADNNRLRILSCLRARPACVCEIVQATGMPQSRVSRHLKVLREAGLVQDDRDAQWVEYSLVQAAPASLEAKVLHFVLKHLEADETISCDRQGLDHASRETCGELE